MISKKIYLVLFFSIILIINGCGYTSIYSSKSNSFKINNIEYEDNKINQKIVKSLKSISNNNSPNKINLIISSSKNKKILSKDRNGKIEKFELRIDLNVTYLDRTETLSMKQNYNNFDNKFQLKEYEKIIENQLIDGLIDSLINYITSIK
jgi:outer membrane lipopolysaccharide assembly protein LptE/RlpB|tara:strand:+ start:1204 stop:1653 length:450 start_codon:yes stop_codon:yes gene_type:complete